MESDRGAIVFNVSVIENRCLSFYAWNCCLCNVSLSVMNGNALVVDCKENTTKKVVVKFIFSVIDKRGVLNFSPALYSEL